MKNCEKQTSLSWTQLVYVKTNTWREQDQFLLQKLRHYRRCAFFCLSWLLYDVLLSARQICCVESFLSPDPFQVFFTVLMVMATRVKRYN